LQVWGDDKGVDKSFDDINDLSVNCHFRDCTHINEPGSAVLEALKNGNLTKTVIKVF
jgi:ribosome biogenesis GTPase